MLLGVGLILVGVGLLLMHGVESATSWTDLLPGFLVAGVGIGLTNPAIASTALGVVPPARAGMASGINSTFRQVGIATGVAGLGAVFQSQIAASSPTLAPQAPPGSPRRRLGRPRGEPSRAPPEFPSDRDAANHAFVSRLQRDPADRRRRVASSAGCSASRWSGASDFVGAPAGRARRRARAALRRSAADPSAAR